MQITKEEQTSKGRFVAKEGNEELGEMTYSLANNGNLMIIDHTAVNDSHAGKGVGISLYKHMVETARGEQRIVMPLCPFARAMFQKNEKDWDVLRHQSL